MKNNSTEIPVALTEGFRHDRLALRPREAARALGIGERLLWSITNRGEIPHVRIGRAIIYPTDALRGWLADRASNNARVGANK